MIEVRRYSPDSRLKDCDRFRERARCELRVAPEPGKLLQRYILDYAIQAKLRRASDLAIERVDRRIEIEKAE